MSETTAMPHPLPSPRRVIAIGRSANGQPFQVMTAPSSLAYSMSMPHVFRCHIDKDAAYKVLFNEGRTAYFDRRGPGSGKPRADGWLSAYREEMREIEARQEERREQF